MHVTVPVTVSEAGGAARSGAHPGRGPREPQGSGGRVLPARMRVKGRATSVPGLPRATSSSPSRLAPADLDDAAQDALRVRPGPRRASSRRP
ncbi:hypothetical protein QJS66_18060 [Kocuria rhizophila]|nr:hypothetical protein QJS66_18060 [Kocuria rhizophila]